MNSGQRLLCEDVCKSVSLCLSLNVVIPAVCMFVFDACVFLYLMCMYVFVFCMSECVLRCVRMCVKKTACVFNVFMHAGVCASVSAFFLCVCIYMHVCMYMCVYLNVCVPAHVRLCVRACVRVCVHVCGVNGGITFCLISGDGVSCCTIPIIPILTSLAVSRQRYRSGVFVLGDQGGAGGLGPGSPWDWALTLALRTRGNDHDGGTHRVLLGGQRAARRLLWRRGRGEKAEGLETRRRLTRGQRLKHPSQYEAVINSM